MVFDVGDGWVVPAISIGYCTAYRLTNDWTRGRDTLGSGSFSNITPTISSPRAWKSLYASERKGASSWQFGHQLPPIVTMTTLPTNCASVFDTILPVRSGNANWNGAVGSLTPV